MAQHSFLRAYLYGVAFSALVVVVFLLVESFLDWEVVSLSAYTVRWLVLGVLLGGLLVGAVVYGFMLSHDSAADTEFRRENLSYQKPKRER